MIVSALPALDARAQDFTLSASVDRGRMSVEEEAVLTVTVAGSSTNLPEPRLPPLPAFEVRGAGRSQNLSFINGAVAGSVEYRYILTPRAAGKALIGPITAADKQTAPIELLVYKHAPPEESGATQAPPAANAAPPQGTSRQQRSAAGPDLFVTAQVDKPHPYVNEQVLLTVRFYTAVPLAGNAQWQAPSAQGFIVEPLPSEPAQEVVEHGRRYVLLTIRSALFPAQAGELTIGPGTVLCQVQQEMAGDPFAPDFFQRFFSQGLVSVQKKEVRTRPVTIRVEPLPAAGKPSSFSGFVGSLRATAETDRRKVKAGEALNLSVTLEGRGNLQGLAAPELPELPQLRAYDTVSSMNAAKDSSGIHGSKTFKTVLVPKVSGNLSIPPMRISYFDPSRRAYLRAQTQPIALDVAPGAPQQDAASFSAPSATPQTQNAGITPVSEDIRHVQPARAGASARRAAALAGSLPAHGAFIAIFLLSLAAKLYRERLLRDPARLRARRARSRAEKPLRTARKEKDSRKAAGLLADATTGFLADKLGCAASGLTLKQAQQDLREKFPSLPEKLLEELKALWDEIDLRRFAPSVPAAGEGDSLVEKARKVLDELDKETRP